MSRPYRTSSAVILAVLLLIPATLAGPASDPLGFVSGQICADETFAGQVCGATLAWASRYNGPETAEDAASAVVASPDGARIYVAGTRLGWGTGLDAMVLAYDAVDGSELWVASHNGPANADDRAVRIAVSSDGSGVFASGTSMGVGTDTDFLTIALDAQTGNEIWAARYDNGGSDTAFSMSLTPDGQHVLVAGNSAGAGTGVDFALVAYRVVDGTVAWTARHNGPTNGNEVWPALAVSPDGSRAVLAGYGAGVGTFDYVTVAFDTTDGAQIWSARYNGPNNGADFGHGALVAHDGSRVFVTGNSNTPTSVSTTIAYDMDDGTQLWIDRYSGAAGNDGTRAMANAPDGSLFYVGGYTRVSTHNDAIVRAYHPASGAIAWAATYDAGSHDGIQAMVASPDGLTLFATGESRGTSTRYDIATLALNVMDGSKRWVGRYNGPVDQDDRPAGIALSPDAKRVFVTGVSPGAGTGADAVTLAYDDELSLQMPEKPEP